MQKIKLSVFRRLFIVLLAISFASLTGIQNAFSQVCAEPGQVCGGSDHKGCCSPVNDKNYVCKGTDGKVIDISTSGEMGSCEEG